MSRRDTDSNSVINPDGSLLVNQLRTEALSLLAQKAFLRNSIKDLEVTIKEGSIDIGTSAKDVSEELKDLEQTVKNATSKLKTKELALKFAQMSSRINGHYWEEILSKPKEDEENSEIRAHFERVYNPQVQYMHLLDEVSELQKTHREKQSESLELIWKTRSLYSELTNIKAGTKDDDKPKSAAAVRMKAKLDKGIRMYNIIRRLFVELISCSQLNWQADEELKEIVMMLDKKLE